MTKHSFEDIKQPFEESAHYANALPEEALMMSRRGRAKGYDDFWWGSKFSGNLPAIVEISHSGVQWRMPSDAEKAWLEAVNSDVPRYRARSKSLHNYHFTRWNDLHPINHEFLLSLTWIPVDPLNAMEVLAKAAQ